MIQDIKRIISESNNIVFFGGAGVSTESGIPDFRTNNGVYNNDFDGYPPETILSHTFFMKNTEKFYKFYFKKMIYKDAKPNSAHNALAELEKRGKLKAIVTQNIDGLHQMAGSKNVLELHGTVHNNLCMNCGTQYDLEYVISSQGSVPKCNTCGGKIKPDVVLYEEELPQDIVRKAIEYIYKAEVLIIGGTSLVVYPANTLIDYYRGNKLILINKTPTSHDSTADYVINDSIGRVLSEVI